MTGKEIPVPARRHHVAPRGITRAESSSPTLSVPRALCKRFAVLALLCCTRLGRYRTSSVAKHVEKGIRLPVARYAERVVASNFCERYLRGSPLSRRAICLVLRQLTRLGRYTCRQEAKTPGIITFTKEVKKRLSHISRQKRLSTSTCVVAIGLSGMPIRLGEEWTGH